MSMKQQSELVRDLTEPGWREREAARDRALRAAFEPRGSAADLLRRCLAWVGRECTSASEAAELNALQDEVRRVLAGPSCGCREGECESKPTGCRMAEEVKPGSGAQ